jgi:cell division protein ZipA
MPELRWTLLIIGVLFIAILAWWERRRPHQASRQDPSWGSDVESSGPRAVPHAVREPTLTLPEIRTEVRTREREPVAPRELPVVEIPNHALFDKEDQEFEEEIEEISEEISEEARDDAAEDPAELASDFSEIIPDAAAKAPGATPETMPEVTPEATPEAIREIIPVVTPEKQPELPPPLTNVAAPIVEWPPEDQRKVVSLRLVARPPDRFRGTLVRQALAGEGFVLGDFGIFHRPDAQNRAVLSAASLTKPGTFDLETMDTQRFAGLSLFAVMPGPKNPRKTFEELLLTARMLNERLEGALQDERGGPLTPMRIQTLRDSLEAETKS